MRATQQDLFAEDAPPVVVTPGVTLVEKIKRERGVEEWD